MGELLQKLRALPWSTWSYVLAAVVTVIVGSFQLYKWITPEEELLEFANVIYDFRDGPFFLPTETDSSDDVQSFLKSAKGFASLSVHNVAKVDLPDIELSVPIDAIVEVQSQGKMLRLFPPAQIFELGTLSPGQQIRVLIWMNRVPTIEEKFDVIHPYGAVSFFPARILTLEEIDYYRRGFYVTLTSTVVLSIVLVVLVLGAVGLRWRTVAGK